MGITAPPWTPTPEQQAETTDDLNDAFKTLEWRMWRKSLFYSWSHEQWTEVGAALRTLVRYATPTSVGRSSLNATGDELHPLLQPDQHFFLS